jgi:hypothetical protein
MLAAVDAVARTEVRREVQKLSLGLPASNNQKAGPVSLVGGIEVTTAVIASAAAAAFTVVTVMTATTVI